MAELHCSNCGILFGMPDFYEKKRRQDHKSFYCPNGHSQYFPAESEAEKYKRLYEEANANSLSAREEVAALRRKTTRVEKQLKDHKKRSAAGVCPCCNRTVAQLAKHMQSKHKEYVALQGVPVQKQLTDGSKPN